GPSHAFGASDREDLVIEAGIDRLLQHGRDEVRRPALDWMRLPCGMAARRRPAGSALLCDTAADQLGVLRFAQHDASLGSLTPKHASNARNGSAGPVTGDEDVQALPGKVIDDFPSGRALMDVGVG